jgi:sulfite exporter TauE/SafE
VSTSVYIAAFIAGCAGSAHCFGMCGGMAGALGMRARNGAASSLDASLQSVLHNVGRISGYALIGAIGGTFGHSAHWALELTRFESGLRIAAGVLTLLIAIRILSGRNALAPLERLGAKMWLRIRPLAVRSSVNQQWAGSIATGLLWGWLPCGLVYSIALMTLTTRSAAQGAATMIAFGLGTLPAMTAASVALGASWPRMNQRPLFRALAGCALLAFGSWMIVATRDTQAHSEHVHEKSHASREAESGTTSPEADSAVAAAHTRPH